MKPRGITTGALAGSVMLLVAVATAPAGAVVAPPAPAAPPAAGTPYAPFKDEDGTLALCIGDQPGATNYLYAEGPTYIPSTQTEMIVQPPPAGIACRAYPAKPGQYWIATYKYAKAPCTFDATRGPTPSANGTGSPQCYAKVHHIHVTHVAGVVTIAPSCPGQTPLGGQTPSATAYTNPYSAFLDTCTGDQTPNLNEAITPGTTDPNGNISTNTNVYGVEYTQPVQSFDDTVIEQQTVYVEVHSHETTQVAAHTTDHSTTDCWVGFDPDANNNPPVCN